MHTPAQKWYNRDEDKAGLLCVCLSESDEESGEKKAIREGVYVGKNEAF